LDLIGRVDIDDFILFQPHVRGPTQDPCDPSLCYDEDPCTLDICVFGECQNIPIPECCSHAVQCMDGDVCTQDKCLAFRCINPPLQCDPPDCEDGIECTSGVCLCGVCGQFEIDLNCDDGVACTRDECIEGAGCTHTPDDSLCPNQDNGDADCITFICQPGPGTDSSGCKQVPEPRYSPCVDSFACSTADYCESDGTTGTCVSQNRAGDNSHCPNQDNGDADCITFICQPGPGTDSSGCKQVPEPPYSPCVDSIACTTADYCVSDGTTGTCVSGGPDSSLCPGGTECLSVVCEGGGPDPGCRIVPEPGGFPCGCTDVCCHQCDGSGNCVSYPGCP